MGTGYAYARELKGDKIQGAAVALVSFFIVMPTKIPYVGVDGPANVSGLAFEYIGSNGLFLSLVIALTSVWVFNWVYRKGWTIKMPDGVPPAVCDSFAALIPSAFVMTLFFFVRIAFEFTPYETAHNFIYQVLQTPLKGFGNTLGAQIVYSLACSGFWFFGINGPAVANTVFSPILKVLTIENLEALQAGTVFSPILKVLTIENLEALQAGLPLPNIFTGPFTDFFTTFGGGGSTLSLVIVMLLFCKSKRITQLGKLSIVPGIFGINEPIIFGLPIVLNPILIIPFIGVPLINLVLSTIITQIGIIPYTTGISLPWTTPIIFSGYLSTLIIPFIGVPLINLVLSTIITQIGIIPYTTGISLPWTTPIIFSGYLSTGSIVSSLWQVVLLVLGCVIYFPFIKILDKQYLRDEENAKNNEDEDISFDELAFDDL